MTGILKNISISGIATAVPENVEKNICLSDILGEKRCKKQIRITGVKQRHVSPEGQKVSDLCYDAGVKLLEHLSWNPQEIDVIILLTQHPNFVCPSTAFLLQKMLGINKNCIAFDVNLGCSAFDVGIQIAASLLDQIQGNAKALCFQGDLAFSLLGSNASPDDIAGAMLFGSAGSVVALEKSESFGKIPFATYSDGSRYKAIHRKYNDRLEMDGEGVYNFSTNEVPESIVQFKNTYNILEDDIDFYVFHQAQKLILDSISLDFNIAPEKELRSVEYFGNTSGASIPLSVCANREKFIGMKEVRILSCGFGVGLSWSMALTTLNSNNILPVIVSNNIY